MGINEIHGFEPVESTCVHAQQYVEKMIKEKLVELGQNPRFDHDSSMIFGYLLDSGYET